MHIKVSFGKVWSVSEVENFIADPKSVDFTSLDKDAYLELATCAECYCTSAQPMSDAEINEAAAQSIASSIEAYFTDEMLDNYIAAALDELPEV